MSKRLGKKLAQEVERVHSEYPDAVVEEECEDEHRKRTTTIERTFEKVVVE